MKREFCKKFRNTRVEAHQIQELGRHLREISKYSKELEAKNKILKDLVIDIIKTDIHGEEVMKAFNGAKRIAIRNSNGIRIDGQNFGLPHSYKTDEPKTNPMSTIVNIGFGYQDEVDFPPLTREDNSYWRSFDLMPDMIKDPKKLEKLKILITDIVKTGFEKVNCLREYQSSAYEGSFLVGVLKSPITYGKLADINPEWVEYLIERYKIPEATVYGGDEEVEEENTFVGEIKRLREILEKTEKEAH